MEVFEEFEVFWVVEVSAELDEVIHEEGWFVLELAGDLILDRLDHESNKDVLL